MTKPVTITVSQLTAALSNCDENDLVYFLGDEADEILGISLVEKPVSFNLVCLHEKDPNFENISDWSRTLIVKQSECFAETVLLREE